ncbi:MAG: dockerin type I domain-containing protein [Erysipelotrichaceae bacterium]|nr:dockerin type I domain-containing protein [Erysipelotrichaceae bacterium]
MKSILKNIKKKIIIVLLCYFMLLPISVYAIDNVPDAPENTIAVGVDISYHNGTIDFEQLATEVNFVIIRCGYGSNYTKQDDANFETYVKGCIENNIPFGVYLYSYADTVAKGKSEEEHALRLVEQISDWGGKLSLPVFYDMEDANTLGKCDASTKAAIAKAFCTVLEDAGYTTGIYANKYWWTTYLTDSYFDDVIKWVAQYYDECTYTGSYSMWQCTSSATSSAADSSLDYNYMIENIFIGNSSSNISGTTKSTISNAQIITNMGFVNSSGYLTGVPLGTSVQAVISSISKASSATTVTITIKNTSSNAITTGTVSTGMTLTLKTNNVSNTYTIVIRGDVNGDGKIKSSDYVRIKNYIMGNVTLTGAQKLAADANKDGSIKSSDYVRIKNTIMGTATITQ